MSIAEAVLETSGLLAYYEDGQHENSGAGLAGGDGTLQNGAQLVNTPLGKAVLLGGASDYVSTPWATMRNSMPRPNFEDGNGGIWTAGSSTVAGQHTVDANTASQGWSALGSWSHYSKATSVIANAAVRFPGHSTGAGTGAIPVPAGKAGGQIAVRLTWKCVQRANDVTQALVRFFDAAGTWLGGATDLIVNAPAGGGAFETAITIPPGAVPATAAFWTVIAYNRHAAGAALVYEGYIDGIQAHFTGDVPNLAALPSYFDGASHADSAWTGAAHASASSKGPFANGSVRAFAAWVYRATNTTTDKLLEGSTAAARPQVYLAGGGDVLTFDPDGSAVGGEVSWTSGIGIGAWRHVILIVDRPANTARLYVDEVDKGSQAAATPYGAPNSTNPFGIGAASSATNPWDGSIAHVATLNRAPTAAERRRLRLGLTIADEVAPGPIATRIPSYTLTKKAAVSANQAGSAGVAPTGRQVDLGPLLLAGTFTTQDPELASAVDGTNLFDLTVA